MAGILKRFTDIMSANVNALLDKAEDPEKMIDQYMRNLQSDLGKVKAETAAVMAEESKAKRQLDECVAEIEKMQTYAMKAVEAGNDDDARQFLAKKKQLEEKKTALEQSYQLAAANASQMKQMHEKLVNDINSLEARRDSIKAKMAVAKTQQTLNRIGNSAVNAESNLAAFDRMEDKAQRMLDEANAMAELNKVGNADSVEDLTKKYDAQPDMAVEDELAALKAKMGK